MRKICSFLLVTIGAFIGVSGQVYSTTADGDFDGAVWDYPSWVGEGPQDGKLSKAWQIDHVLTRNGDVTSTQAGAIYGTLNVVEGDYKKSGGGSDVIYDGGRLEIWGNLTATQKIEVRDGGLLIVHGDASFSNSGSQLSGDVIVTGNVYLKNTDVVSTGNLIIGGNLEVANGGGSFNGDIYQLDPDASTTFPNYKDVDVGGEDEMMEDDDMVDVLLEILEDAGMIEGSLLPPHQWNGGESDDWFTAANWTYGVVPDASSDITIVNSGNAPVIGDGAIAYVNNLTIEADASLTLEPGARMTIQGDLITNDQLTVKNTVDAPVSLIVNGNVNGETNYEWEGMTKQLWWYISHPVTDVTETDYDNSYGVGRYVINRYSKDSWFRVAGYVSSDDIYDFSSDPDSDVQLEGYDLYPAEDVPLRYAGVLNNEDYSRTYTKAQWWLVANPYPSYMDVEDAGFDMGNFGKTVYIRKSDNSVSAYNVLNGVGVNEGSRYIAPGQSVWLRTYNATDYVNISTTARVHETGGYGLKSGSAEENDRLRLALSSDHGTDEIVMIFNVNGSELYTAYDSEKLFNSGNIANLYSEKDGKDVAINFLPELEPGTVIPLSYKVNEDGLSDFTIRATNINSFIPEVDVYLEDKEEGVTINLRETAEYTFIPLATSTSDRFELKFEASVSTDIESNEAEISLNNVTIYAVNQKAYVVVSEELLMAEDRAIEVYNLSGQLKAQYALNTTKTVFDLPESKTMYIIKVSVDQSSYQEKVVVF
ncbi:T9SS type A sorting domain-containing protein [Saccharicrinis fermentans]|uniref:Secretion system C-terminal sorting domain-containing protein n=1 Tax=Saccharicrinis fermentans DSM 9555 = JCM 21142 TaxID=869213 RepID=W7YI41_9BACT|nr:T9SS type A sorting domain-containing protein [Saccharicrinis fermentans]GAF04146.1 hypothetical protein JCM21142_72842 [Saccharicrinis fermentans DSM 9555 = JCM 21142]